METLIGWFTGAKLYALIGLGVVLLALSGSVAFLWQVHKTDVAQLALDKRNAQILTDALKESEADKALLTRKAKELDAAIQERDSRLKALNETKRKLANELDRLKNTVPPEDKACLDRPLPAGILDLLRDPVDGHEDGTGDSPGKPLPAVQ